MVIKVTPDRYFYEVPVSAVNWGYAPSAVLSVPRLLESKPFFQQASESTLKKKKTLIVNVITLSQMDDNQQIILSERLTDLENNGFTVHHYPQMITDGAFFSTEQEAAKHFNLARDEVFLLTDDEMTQLIAGDDDDWRYLSSFKHVNLSHSNISGNSLEHFLSEKGPEIESLDLSGCMNLQDASFEGLNLSNLKTLILGSSLALEERINLSYSPNKERLNNLSSLAIQQLIQASSGSLKFVNLNMKIPESENELLMISADTVGELMKMKDPSTLELAFCRCPVDDLLEALNPNALQSLNLSGAVFNRSETLGKFLAQIMSLKTLWLQALPPELFEEGFDSFDSSRLATLSLSYSGVTLNVLNKILKNAGSLKVLELNKCEHLFGDLKDLDLALSSLERLDACDAKINIELLKELVYCSEHLKVLNLKGADLSGILPRPFLEFRFLESFDASGSKIEPSSVYHLLHRSSCLKTLDLSRCMNLSTGEWRGFNFPLLESFKASGSKIEPSSMYHLLHNSALLKTLDLSDCTSLSNREWGAFDFPLLEKLDLHNTCVRTKTLKNILAKTSGLEELMFGPLSDQLGDLLETVDTSVLKLLVLNNVPMTQQSVRRILARSPHLANVTLGNCGLSDKERNELMSEYPNICLVSYNTSNTDYTSGYKNTDKTDEGLAAQEATEQQKFVPERTKMKSLDANTKPDPEKIFKVDELFYPGAGAPAIDLTLYRLETFNGFDITKTPCDIGRAFTLKNTSSDLLLSLCTVTQATEDLFSCLNTLPKRPAEYYCKKTIALSSEWTPLPSISPHDQMMSYHLSQAVDVDIQYSSRDNLYYIRSKPDSMFSESLVDIDFIIEVPSPASCSLPDDIEKKIRHYQGFKEKELILPQSHFTGQDYLDALNKQEVGACRHRSFLFKAWMSAVHPDIPTRIVDNACHSFIELQIGGEWLSYNLGGYAAKLEVKALELPLAKPSKSPVSVVITSGGTVLTTSLRQYFSREAPEKKEENALAYVHHLLSNTDSSTLIKADDSTSIAGLRYHLQEQCQHIKRPCFYVHSPDDLICSAAYIKRGEDNTGRVSKGPGGPLHDFLTAHADDGTRPLLIVNYDNFTPSDIVRVNALLDETRVADKTPLPKNTQVIGLINPKKPGVYDGADFYSRFKRKVSCPLSGAQLFIPSVIAPESFEIDPEAAQHIKLYGGGNWEIDLLGQWTLNGKNLAFKEGALVQALKAGKTHVILSNAPWGDPAFDCFWQNAMLYGYVVIQGEKVFLPDGFTLGQSEGYALEQAKTIIYPLSDDSPAPSHVLNPSLIGPLMGDFIYKEDAIYQNKGLIEANAGKNIAFYLSHSLNKTEWLRILDECTKHQVTLSLRLAPGVELPQAFNTGFLSASAPISTTLQVPVEDTYISSTDVDATLAKMDLSHYLVINVSEVSPGDLFGKINAQFNEEQLAFHFQEAPGVLKKYEAKPILLKGPFSQEMQHLLSNALYQRQQNSGLRTPLIVMGTAPGLFPFLKHQTDSVTLEDKKSALQQAFPEHVPLDDAHINTKSFAQLQAIYRAHPVRQDMMDVDAPWKGMHTLPAGAVKSVGDMDLSNAQFITEAFNQHRIEAVTQALSHSPFVFLAGMSGVGKTSFVQRVYDAGALYVGKDRMLDWARDASLGMKTLFLDEANLSSDQWSAFEGLLDNTPPTLLIGNDCIELTPEHRVIFAGNPMSYGGERQMPSFFLNHGNSVIFEPLPAEYIYHEILEPILSEQTQEIAQQMAQPMLNIANFLTACSHDSVLISPRELASMALFTRCYCENNPSANPTAVAQYYAYSLSKNLVPENFRVKFEHDFKGDAPTARALPTLHEYQATEAHRPAREALEDFLTLRELRQRKAENDTQQSGGLGGLIIEGEPGVGKTELVAKTLLAHGLKKYEYYVIPANMSLLEKKEQLLKAFDEGAVVVMDEINSSPMMESLLNDLLMGRAPDGRLANNPGFLLIGTQNPVTYAGRATASTALSRRMQSVSIPEYTSAEMASILQHKGVEEIIAREMVQQYLERQKLSDTDSTIPKLCFRDLLNCAEAHLRAAARVPEDLLNDAKTVSPSSETQRNQLSLLGFFGETSHANTETPTEQGLKCNSSLGG